MLLELINPILAIQRVITLDDYAKSCSAENGGADEIVVYQICDREPTGYVVDADRNITALVMKAGKQAYKWTPDMESILINDNGTRSRENNAYMRPHSCTITFKDDEDVTAKLDEDSGRVFLGIIYKKSVPAGETAVWKHIGFFNGMALTTSEGPVGQLYDDLRGHILNFEGKELTRALVISDTIVDSLLNPPS